MPPRLVLNRTGKDRRASKFANFPRVLDRRWIGERRKPETAQCANIVFPEWPHI